MVFLQDNTRHPQKKNVPSWSCLKQIINSLKTFSQGVIQKVQVTEKWTKNEQGGGLEVLVCVYVRLKKNAEFFKINFYSHSPIFRIDYNGSMKY